MNQRIQQLYMQAHEQKPIIVMDSETCEPTHKLGHGGVPMYHNVFDPEKFAELIVQECLHMADEFELDVNRSGLVDRMKEHFGLDNKSHSK